ncbi:MAG: DNA polymerase/3'-5' exonuclease PolX [Candidatus Aminicenantales bacterium]
MAAIFSKIADALEIKGEMPFKILAYRKAARILEDLTEDIETVADENRLQKIDGIGSGIASKIEEYLQTGRMKKHRDALSGIPESLFELLNVQNLGAKTVHLMQKELGVQGIADLKRVIRDGTLASLHGMGDKKVENIRKGIETHEKAQERIPIYEALSVAEEVIAYLTGGPGIGRLSPAGSLRRMKESVGDIDILAAGSGGASIVRYFTRFPRISCVLAAGPTKGSVMITTRTGERQVDLRVVADPEYGAALQYFTGSKAHNIKLRGLAKDKELKISEYGVFRGSRKIAGRDESEVYTALGLPFIPPEMREDRGEIELAIEGRLPDLVDKSHIRGDLHVHSDWSDGQVSLSELADLARERGYSYIAVCDHSQAAKYAGGLTPDRLRRQMKEIDALNRRLKGIRLLKGTEVDILADGSLDLPDQLLGELDIVVGSIHSGFRKNVTARMLKAMENPHLDIIGHPTGRLISGREGYEVDLEAVLAGARRLAKALELNSYPDRLDLNEFHLKRARELEVMISIGTDTHSADGLGMMRFGVGIARRAWLQKKDILNNLPWSRLKKMLK